MELRFLEHDEGRVKFVLSGVDSAFVNALRRTMIADVPKLAVDEVEIYENTSLLYDEQIALRLALIPLRCTEELVHPEDCECGGKGCEKCEVKLQLEYESPDTEGSITIYSKDLKPLDERVSVVHQKIPLIRLTSLTKDVGSIRMPVKQRVSLIAKARMGTGREHAKWQPVTVCGYKNTPIIRINEEICRGCGRCAEECPKNLINVHEKAEISDELSCILCKLCENACEKKAIRVMCADDSFVFFAESDGSLTIDHIVTKAARIMQRRCDNFISELESTAAQ